MAVNVKYRHEYKPTQTGHYIVNLCDVDFTGSATDIEMTSTPFTLEWKNDDPHAKVISSEANMNFICETQAQVDWFTEVAQSPTGTYTVEILDGSDDSLFWCGVIQAESVTIPYLTPPLVINVVANDDLARLADSFHNQTGLEGGTPYAYDDQLITIHIRRALSRIRTYHHWENTDTFLQLIDYYETTAGDGLNDILVPSVSFDLTENEDTGQGGGDYQAMTDLDVLENICMVFNSRLILDGGMFRFHSISLFENAVNYMTSGVINITKGGTVSTIAGTNLRTQFSQIQKYGGWETTYMPALKSVKMETTGGFWASFGRATSLPHYNQILNQSGNLLNGTFYNTVGDAFYLYAMGEPGTAYHAHMQQESTLVQVNLAVLFNAFQLNESDAVDNVIRVKVTVLCVNTLYGTNEGALRYAKNTATFDTDATTPIIAEDGSSVECASVTYTDPIWTTNSSDRLVYYSAPIDCSGNNQRAADDLISFIMPAVNIAANGSQDWAIPRIGGMIEVVAHDGTALASGVNTTVQNAWEVGYFIAPSMYSSTNPTYLDEDATRTMWTATQQTTDFRENLDLGLCIFGMSPQSQAYMLTSSGAAADWTSNGNTDGTDWLAQLVVKDVLRLRSKPRALFVGNGILNTTNYFPFWRIYEDDGTRYALLGASLDGGTNITTMTFFELVRDDSVTISDTDIKSPWWDIGTTVATGGGGSVVSPSGFNSGQYVSVLGGQNTTTKADLAISRIFKKEERRMVRGRILENGSMLCFPLDPTNTNAPNITIFTANDGSGTQTENSTTLTSNAGIKGETIQLPRLGTTAGNHFMTMATQAGGSASMAASVAYGTTAGHVLQMVNVAGNLIPQFAAPSGGGQGGSGGFYTVTGYRTFKGTGPVWFTLIGTTMTTDATSPLVNYAVTEDGTVTDFSIYSAATSSTSASMRLYKNGSTAETETVTLGVDATTTGTFSTSVSAGDLIRFQISPLANPGGSITLTVKIEVS